MRLDTWQVFSPSILCQFWNKRVLRDRMTISKDVRSFEPLSLEQKKITITCYVTNVFPAFSIAILATWTASAPARTTTATTAATASRTTTSKTKTGEAGNERKLKRPKISSQADASSSPESIKRFRRQLRTFSRSQMSEKLTVLNLEEPEFVSLRWRLVLKLSYINVACFLLSEKSLWLWIALNQVQLALLQLIEHFTCCYRIHKHWCQNTQHEVGIVNCQLDM